MSLSQRIVDFIGGLLPLYIEDEVDGVWCARSLSDGTLICPVEEMEACEDGFVTVHWQGDQARQTLVQGTIHGQSGRGQVRGASLPCGKTPKAPREEIEHLANHFTVKTGALLTFQLPDSELPELIGKAVGKVGEAVVTEAIKKLVGL
jgi:hypothetical protein